MNQTVMLPLWAVTAGGLLVAWAVYSLLLVPGVRWFFRRRANLLIGELNDRLDLRIPPIALTRRKVLVDRLVYDPRVIQEVDDYCETEGVPRDVAVSRVRHYAGEVVPAFNAYVYFRFGSWLSKRITELLYRVRLGYADEEGLHNIDPNSSVVFVMNHRSNVDYVLVAYLALNRVALSYAVGEWARVWPLQQLVRAMGAYFVRRGSGNRLYRRVLERYVQMAVEGGAAQAVFPEGGLSRDGLMREPRIGLLDYMLRKFDPDGDRDIVFVPVALNYDRVLEDRTLLAENEPHAEHKSGRHAARTAMRFALRNLSLRMRGKLYRFGYACANFGSPISLREYTRSLGWTPYRDPPDTRIERVKGLAEELMLKVGELVPVLPVSLLSTIFLSEPERWRSIAELQTETKTLLASLGDRGARIYLPREDESYFVTVGVRMLTLRHLVDERGEKYRPVARELPVLRYYANAIQHLLKPK